MIDGALLIIIFSKVSCNLQEWYSPLIILRLSKLWPLDVFCDCQLIMSHWHLLLCVEINTTGLVVIKVHLLHAGHTKCMLSQYLTNYQLVHSMLPGCALIHAIVLT